MSQAVCLPRIPAQASKVAVLCLGLVWRKNRTKLQGALGHLDAGGPSSKTPPLIPESRRQKVTMSDPLKPDGNPPSDVY